MGRVINPETAGKERTQLSRAIVLALRELMQQPEPNHTSRDLAAFIALALQAIHDTIDSSVTAWEKRGYWVKADQFRMEWAWSGQVSEALRQALAAEDWDAIIHNAVKVAQKLNNVKVPQRNRVGTPWAGAYQQLRNGAPKVK
ncbi:MAG: hypothetical protein ACOYYS_17230 [Chloroflexota bacterium]